MTTSTDSSPPKDRSFLISLLALAAAVFFAGSMIGGNWRRQKILKDELQAIEADYQAVQQRLAAIDSTHLVDEGIILADIDLMYAQLDTLEKKKTAPVPRRAARVRVSGFSY